MWRVFIWCPKLFSGKKWFVSHSFWMLFHLKSWVWSVMEFICDRQNVSKESSKSPVKQWPYMQKAFTLRPVTSSLRSSSLLQLLQLLPALENTPVWALKQSDWWQSSFLLHYTNIFLYFFETSRYFFSRLYGLNFCLLQQIEDLNLSAVFGLKC